MRVMLVEDEADIAHFMGVMLNFYDVQTVTWLADYQLLLAPEHWTDINVAVVDHMLGHDQPRGDEILGWLREHRPDIRRVRLSATAATANGLAHHYLTKPAPAQALLTAIGVDTSANG